VRAGHFEALMIQPGVMDGDLALGQTSGHIGLQRPDTASIPAAWVPAALRQSPGAWPNNGYPTRAP
jgi:hypothetical protein